MAGSDGRISVEPAGQLELSGAPLTTIHGTCAETGRHVVIDTARTGVRSAYADATTARDRETAALLRRVRHALPRGGSLIVGEPMTDVSGARRMGEV